ncbi:MAG TPA: MaoC family dehydratase [Longimicrobium sp.]|nr:MaoC family dehydratase [Longimicrobium sp.]
MLERTGEREFTETQGMYYEDFEVGVTIKHWPGRTISEVDNTWLTLLLLNTHPAHFDAEYAKGTEFGRVLVNSSITLALVGGMTVRTLSAAAVANLGWDRVRLPNPTFVGDTLYARSEILHKRPSRSRPTQGIVSVRTVGYKSTGEEVITFERSFLVPMRHPPAPETPGGEEGG